MADTLTTGITRQEAERFYDRYGRKLDWSDAFEGKAKAVAFARCEPTAGQTVAEIGVGCGHFLAYASDRVGGTGRAVGIDVSRTMIDLARKRAPAARLLRASAFDLPLASESVDWAFTSYTFDLMPLWGVDRALAELRRVLRPDGRLVLCGLTEGRSLLERTFMGLWKRIHRLAPSQLGGCRPLQLADPLERAGFEILSREHVGQLGTPSEVFLARRNPPV